MESVKKSLKERAKIDGRLDWRHEMIKKAVENLAELPGASGKSKDESDKSATLYRLAVTNLFVEKAQYHLEERATQYTMYGYMLYGLAIVVLIAGACLAIIRMEAILPTDAPTKPLEMIHQFLLAFTAYGFIAVTVVALTRGARACLDQRERLLAKRHSLRQGRLYLNLHDADVTIDEMERAFVWNHEQHNAFTKMHTDVQAPLGAMVSEIGRTMRAAMKAKQASTSDAGTGMGPPL